MLYIARALDISLHWQVSGVSLSSLTSVFSVHSMTKISKYLCFCFHRIEYSGGGVGPVSQELYEGLTSIQMGRAEDKLKWILEL